MKKESTNFKILMIALAVILIIYIFYAIFDNLLESDKTTDKYIEDNTFLVR